MNKPGYTLLSTLDKMPATVETLLSYADTQKIWLFEGEMGAGKTTLIRALCAQLGVQDNVCSPTFSLINEYTTSLGTSVYHFDFYRIKHEAEAFSLDCTAYFESGSYCFIEWPSKIPNLLPQVYYKVCLTTQKNGERILQVSLHRDEA